MERATLSELRRLKCSPKTSGLAALAVSLAVQIDTARGAVAAAAAAAKLRLIRADLAAEAERSTARRDTLDELNARRAVRRPAAAG